MIYLICQDWLNTSNNHAGIKYLCNKLVELYPETYSAICNPAVLPPAAQRPKNRILRRLQWECAKIKHQMNLRSIFSQIESSIKENDKIVLMEYMEILYPMDSLAKRLKKRFPSVELSAMIHLVPARLDKDFGNQAKFERWISYVDKVFTLGSSLTDYLVKRGIPEAKIQTTFHYVDKYYFNNETLKVNDPVQVIAMGSQMRNIQLLSKVVKDNPNTSFVICQGFNDLSSYFKDTNNVRLIPFVPEQELRQLMAESDISLNVMEDTIGSNVIVTSLAMGLAMVCSDVGSIHEYCSNENTIFCQNGILEGFSDAISQLSSDKKYLLSMKESARESSKRFSIEKFHNYISKY